MQESGAKLLNLMFRPGETICVSPNQFGYHSIPLETVLSGDIVLVPTQESAAKRGRIWEDTFEKAKSDDMTMVALNPIKGQRSDLNCTAFRNFLIEMDYGPLPEQLAYAKKIGLPYSACIFSGNKSLHFLISLDQDLPSEDVYRKFSQWILAIASAADEKTKNPSRSIRIPGAWREPDKKQRMVEFNGPTPITHLVAWLKMHPDAEPKEHEKREISPDMDFSKVKPWVLVRLVEGLAQDKGRNQQWFAIACEFALAGYEEDDTLDKLSQYFQPAHDFKEREWKTAIRSGFKYIYERN